MLLKFSPLGEDRHLSGGDGIFSTTPGGSSLTKDEGTAETIVNK